MNTNFGQWLEEQTYILTDGGTFSYRWSELIYLADCDDALAKINPARINRSGYRWGLWRKIRTSDNVGGSNQEDQT